MLSLLSALNSTPMETIVSSQRSLLDATENVGLLFLFTLGVLLDLSLLGLGGDSNSRWLSFLDSLSHCSSWSYDEAALTLPQQLVGTILSKYGSGLVVSALLSVTPGFLQTNTMLSFTLAVALAQSNPRLASLVRSRHGPWRTLFVMIGSLHKSRKLKFAIFTCAEQPLFAIFVGLLAIELTGWLVVLGRSFFRDENPIFELVDFLKRYRLRLLFTAAAVIFTLLEWPPVFVILALVLHKGFTPDVSGARIGFELM